MWAPHRDVLEPFIAFSARKTNEMTFERLMEDSLQGDWPGDEKLMDECAAIVDGVQPGQLPRYVAVIRPIKYFIESMSDEEFDEYPGLKKFLLDLAQAADRAKGGKKKGSVIAPK